MTYADAMAHFQRADVIAARLGCTVSLVYTWAKTGLIPEKHAIQLHLHSNKEVPIDPDDYNKELAPHAQNTAPDGTPATAARTGPSVDRRRAASGQSPARKSR